MSIAVLSSTHHKSCIWIHQLMLISSTTFKGIQPITCNSIDRLTLSSCLVWLQVALAHSHKVSELTRSRNIGVMEHGTPLALRDVFCMLGYKTTPRTLADGAPGSRVDTRYLRPVLCDYASANHCSIYFRFGGQKRTRREWSPWSHNF